MCSGLRPRPEPCDERYVGLYGTGISLEETNPPAIPRCDTNEACSIESVLQSNDSFHTRIVKMMFDNCSLTKSVGDAIVDDTIMGQKKPVYVPVWSLPQVSSCYCEATNTSTEVTVRR